MENNDTYANDTGISNNKWFELDAEYIFSLLEIKQHKNTIWDNDDKATVDVGESVSSFDADADDKNDVAYDDGDRNNNSQEKLEASDDTQQYSKRIREQVINDKYILKQLMTKQNKIWLNQVW